MPSAELNVTLTSRKLLLWQKCVEIVNWHGGLRRLRRGSTNTCALTILVITYKSPFQHGTVDINTTLTLTLGRLGSRDMTHVPCRTCTPKGNTLWHVQEHLSGHQGVHDGRPHQSARSTTCAHKYDKQPGWGKTRKHTKREARSQKVILGHVREGTEVPKWCKTASVPQESHGLIEWLDIQYY